MPKANPTRRSYYGLESASSIDGKLAKEKEKDTIKLPSLAVEVIEEVKRQWDFALESEFNPVPHALSLLDDSSLGRDLKAFETLYDRLEKAMDLIVNEYHQNFNRAIQKFSGVVENISDSQIKVRSMRKALNGSKDLLGNKSFDLFHLWLKSCQHNEMLKILDSIEELIKIPEKIDQMISEKYYLSASRLLVKTMDKANAGDMIQIGALVDVRSRLSAIHDSLPDKMIEDLNAHLYFKSPYSRNRISKSSAKMGRALSEEFSIQSLNRILEPSENMDMNAEANSFQFMLNILESLHLIGTLPNSALIIKDGIQPELYKVLEEAIHDIEMSETFQEETLKTTGAKSKFKKEEHFYLHHKCSTRHAKNYQKFLKTVYEQLETIFHGHFYCANVVSNIKKRYPDSPVPQDFTPSDIWFLIQNEVKNFLQASFGDPQHILMKDSLNSIHDSTESMQGELLFEIDNARNDSAIALYETLTKIRETEDKGLVRLDSLSQLDFMFSVDRLFTGRLVERHPYNVLLAFEPTLKFMNRIESLLGTRFGSLETFLNDFILNVFLPHMEEKIADGFAQVIQNTDAFQKDYSPNTSTYPVMKSALNVISLIQEICETLPDIRVHQEEVVAFIESILHKYFDGCLAKFKEITCLSNDVILALSSNVPTIASYRWSQNEKLRSVLMEFFLCLETQRVDTSQSLFEKEVAIQLKLQSQKPILESELLLDPKKLHDLANMFYSLEWLIVSLTKMQILESDVKVSELLGSPIMSPTQPKPLAEKEVVEEQDTAIKRSESTESLTSLPLSEEKNVAMPLNSDSYRRLDAILSKYKSLSRDCLFTLRTEMRCHIIYYLDLALREGSYFLMDDHCEPEKYLATLNLDLANIEDIISTSTSDVRANFMFEGLPYFLAEMLIRNLNQVKQPNVNGLKKLVRSVNAIQQNLQNMSLMNLKPLDRARTYYELLLGGPENMLKYMERHPGIFSFDEYSVLLNVMYADELNRPHVSPEKKAALDSHKQRLNNYFLQHNR